MAHDLADMLSKPLALANEEEVPSYPTHCLLSLSHSIHGMGRRKVISIPLNDMFFKSSSKIQHLTYTDRIFSIPRSMEVVCERRYQIQNRLGFKE